MRIVVLDNEQYGETGQQPTHTATGTDLAAVARACGIARAATVRRAGEVARLRDQLHDASGLLCAVVKMARGAAPRHLPLPGGTYLTHRLREALLGAERAAES